MWSRRYKEERTVPATKMEGIKTKKAAGANPEAVELAVVDDPATVAVGTDKKG